MKTHFNIIFPLSVFALFTALAALPQQAFTQRFSHTNFGGGGANRGGAVVSRPPQNMSRPAPAVSRPAPVAVNRPAPSARPAPVMNRPEEPQANNSINGGSRNFGNHNFNQVRTAAPPRVNVRDHAHVSRNAAPHENLNVYHPNNQPAPYAYHPYHPYYWGNNWHPIGYIAASLAADAYLFSLANQQYYYDDGVYYEPSSGGYSVIPAPIGAVVSSLPPGYETTMVGNDYYYYYGGAFYIDTGSAYQVVPAPVGAVVTEIPDGAVEQDINGQSYLVYNNTYYQPVSESGQDAYQVVQVQ